MVSKASTIGAKRTVRTVDLQLESRTRTDDRGVWVDFLTGVSPLPLLDTMGVTTRLLAFVFVPAPRCDWGMASTHSSIGFSTQLGDNPTAGVYVCAHPQMRLGDGFHALQYWVLHSIG